MKKILSSRKNMKNIKNTKKYWKYSSWKGGWENPLANRSTRSPTRLQTPYNSRPWPSPFTTRFLCAAHEHE